MSCLTIIAVEVGRGLADSETVEDQDWLCSASPDCVRSAFSRRESGDNDILLPGILWACETILTYPRRRDDSPSCVDMGRHAEIFNRSAGPWAVSLVCSVLRSRAKPLFNV